MHPGNGTGTGPPPQVYVVHLPPNPAPSIPIQVYIVPESSQASAVPLVVNHTPSSPFQRQQHSSLFPSKCVDTHQGAAFGPGIIVPPHAKRRRSVFKVAVAEKGGQLRDATPERIQGFGGEHEQVQTSVQTSEQTELGTQSRKDCWQNNTSDIVTDILPILLSATETRTETMKKKKGLVPPEVLRSTLLARSHGTKPKASFFCAIKYAGDLLRYEVGSAMSVLLFPRVLPQRLDTINLEDELNSKAFRIPLTFVCGSHCWTVMYEGQGGLEWLSEGWGSLMTDIQVGVGDTLLLERWVDERSVVHITRRRTLQCA
jgi:hypothetical protein